MPNQFTMTAGPAEVHTHVSTGSFYAQDQWTMQTADVLGRDSATTTCGATSRSSSSGRIRSSRSPLSTTRPTACRTTTSRRASAPRYDLFGNGKTAIKVNVGKYLVAADGSSITGGLLNPLSRVSTSANRTWTDANRNFRPDCDLLNPQAQDLSAVGRRLLRPEQQPELRPPGVQHHLRPRHDHGWGKRSYDWNFGVQVQQELLPRVSVNVGYFRRIFGNFFVTDNLATSATDYNTFSITAPSDPRLPGGGGYTRRESGAT